MVDMKVLMQPVEVIAYHSADGLIRPERLRITEGDEQTVVRIDKILARSEEKVGKERELFIRCRGVIGERMQVFELKYRAGECRWYLYRM
ncbi:hypothetical protein [Desulfosporosinus fructosivorans]